MTKTNCFEVEEFHRLEPRYDEIEEIDQLALDKEIAFFERDGTAPSPDAKIHKKVYICDICSKCGFIVKRQD